LIAPRPRLSALGPWPTRPGGASAGDFSAEMGVTPVFAAARPAPPCQRAFLFFDGLGIIDALFLGAAANLHRISD
jgi:hypothetical protein